MLDRFLFPRRRARLRSELMRLPVTAGYPFDVEAKLLRSIGVQPAMLDIGAGSGIYGALLEDVVGSENLYLFEPVPQLSERLLRRFRRAHVFDFGLSATAGAQEVLTGEGEIAVRYFALDDVVRSLALDSIGLVRIDVGGHEDAVLDGARRTIDRFRPLLLVRIDASRHTAPIAEVFARIEALGYKGHYVVPETFSLRATAHFDVELDQNREDLAAQRFSRYLDNFFFVPQEQGRDFVAKAHGFLEAERQHVVELIRAGRLPGR
jgi:hypothetical protein